MYRKNWMSHPNWIFNFGVTFTNKQPSCISYKVASGCALNSGRQSYVKGVGDMRKPYITKIHIILEILSYVLIIASFMIAIIGVNILPEEIPTHYDLSGNVDGYGSPAVLFGMPVTILLCNLITSLIAHFMNPAYWSMPVKVKEAKKIILYKDVVSLVVAMELEFAVFTLVFTIMSFTGKMGGAMLLSLLLLGAVTISIVGTCVLMKRHNK